VDGLVNYIALNKHARIMSEDLVKSIIVSALEDSNFLERGALLLQTLPTMEICLADTHICQPDWFSGSYPPPPLGRLECR
jgi:hypothetical protein